MAAITQPRTFSPYVGGRYGSFAGKENAAVPDFMHGTLNLFLSLSGEIKMQPYLSGQIHCEPYLRGGIEVNP